MDDKLVKYQQNNVKREKKEITVPDSKVKLVVSESVHFDVIRG